MNNIKKVSGCVIVTMEEGKLILEGLKVNSFLKNGVVLDEIRLYAKSHRKQLNDKITILIFDIVKAKTAKEEPAKEEPEEFMFYVNYRYLIKNL